jgi:hypothetical protein
MTRAILALSGSAATRRLGFFFTTVWHELSHRYRPERHYMRGPGPAWRAKHG